jgi:hypothetical protein
LQSSDRIANDICDALPQCSGGQGDAATAPELTLVLRQWRTLTPGREFRCFVVGGELAGVGRLPPFKIRWHLAAFFSFLLYNASADTEMRNIGSIQFDRDWRLTYCWNT